jgi:hypothetical protein
MIFSINQTFQCILASIAQGGGGWSSSPPKFALDQKSPLRSLQRPPVGGTDPVGNHGSKECGILDISQPYRPPRLDEEVVLPFFAIILNHSNIWRIQYIPVMLSVQMSYVGKRPYLKETY